jgi:hypothetical protein
VSVQPIDLKRIVKDFLKIMERDEVVGLLEYEQPEKKFFIEGRQDEYVSVDFRPSSRSKKAYAKSPMLSYVGSNGVIVLEVRINSYEKYSRIMFRTTFLVPGYEQFAVDEFGNTVQDKKIESTDIFVVKKELNDLLNLLN